MNNYSPSKEQIKKIIANDRFRSIYADTAAKYSGDGAFSWAIYSFQKYMGWTGGIFGFGERPYSERYTGLQKQSIPERNAASYAANLAAGQIGSHQEIPEGDDLFTEVIPGYVSAAKDGALEGVQNVGDALKIITTIAVIGVAIYATTEAVKLYNTAKA